VNLTELVDAAKTYRAFFGFTGHGFGVDVKGDDDET
jgi:hypothetical protein